MIKPNIPDNDAARIAELESYQVLDTIEESEYDDLTAIAAHICDTPIALISLVDGERQWFKSHHGLAARETPRDLAFCAHAINDPENIFMVPDSSKDERFFDNPLATGEPHVVFYAGMPLVSQSGHPLGTLCVIDHVTKELTPAQTEALKSLSRQVVRVLELRKERLNLEARNLELEQYAAMAAHDLKAPLNNIQSVIDLIQHIHREDFSSEVQELLDIIDQSTESLTSLIDGLLLYSMAEDLGDNQKEVVNARSFLEKVKQLLGNETCNITIKTDITDVNIHAISVEQVVMNLVSNAIKYGDKPVTDIDMSWSTEGGLHSIAVTDNGPGIPQDRLEEIFVVFKRLKGYDRFGKAGHGLGLATARKVARRIGGHIGVTSEVGTGSTFTFTFPV